MYTVAATRVLASTAYGATVRSLWPQERKEKESPFGLVHLSYVCTHAPVHLCTCHCSFPVAAGTRAAMAGAAVAAAAAAGGSVGGATTTPSAAMGATGSRAGTVARLVPHKPRQETSANLLAYVWLGGCVTLI